MGPIWHRAAGPSALPNFRIGYSDFQTDRIREGFIRSRGLGDDVIAIVSTDRRGSGYGLERYLDNPRIDFTRLAGLPGVHFTHSRGFVAKTTVTDVSELKCLLAVAALNAPGKYN